MRRKLFSYVILCFRTAKEAEDNIRRALEKGQVLPKEDRFDSNCITPGIYIYIFSLFDDYCLSFKCECCTAWRCKRIVSTN